MEANKTMTLVTELPGQSMILFRLIPCKTECPYSEAIYDAQTGTLHIKAKHTETIFQEVERTDTNGEVLRYHDKTSKKFRTKTERKSITSQAAYSICFRDEVDAFIARHAENADQVDHGKIIGDFREMIEKFRSEREQEQAAAKPAAAEVSAEA